MKIEILKKPDSAGILRCTRADGSVAWQKQTKHASHFALHDMTHFAVEQALGYSNGFFGLIAQGWEIEDTERSGALPAEALEVERIVGLLDAERAGHACWSASDFNLSSPRPLTDAELSRVRNLRADLFSRWAQIEPGQALVLEFAPNSI